MSWTYRDYPGSCAGCSLLARGSGILNGEPTDQRDDQMTDERDGRLTITEAALLVGVSTKTILRWEKAGRIAKAKRDWRGWRVFTEHQVQEMARFREELY